MIAAFMHHHHHDSAAAVPPPNGSDGPHAHPSSPSSLLAVIPAPLKPQSQPLLLAHDDSAANSAHGPAAHANGAASADSAAGARIATATGQRPRVLISAAGSPAGTGAARPVEFEFRFA